MKTTRLDRGRRLALAGLGAIPLSPLLSRFALAADSPTLNSLRRVALVVGNSAYPDPENVLRNAVNDAVAMAAELQGMGFAVTRLVDAKKPAFHEAIERFSRGIEGAVGLFYFAGHGFQLGWRNYLVPVDARFETDADVREQAVDLQTLMRGLQRAGNPMNIVILDACRDNPFVPDLKSGKGLSQMDAPPGTILAYATAPGNGAADVGSREKNGLYTGHLLNEMRARDAKIEDVFKRVRLNVRRESKGAQIPWESTSLEEDFFLHPPAQSKKASEEERDREYAEQLEAWNRLDSSEEALAAFLRRYPSGHFSELAQVRLDRVLASRGEKKVAIVDSRSNPFTAGSAASRLDYRVGDEYAYRTIDLHTNIARPGPRLVVSAVGDGAVTFANGFVSDLLGNTVRDTNGRRVVANQAYPAEYALGKKWVSRFHVEDASGVVDETEIEFRIVARETITVPAGTFDTFRIVGTGWARGGRKREVTHWMAPDRVRRFVAREQSRSPSPAMGVNARGDKHRIELVRYSEQA